MGGAEIGGKNWDKILPAKKLQSDVVSCEWNPVVMLMPANATRAVGWANRFRFGLQPVRVGEFNPIGSEIQTQTEPIVRVGNHFPVKPTKFSQQPNKGIQKNQSLKK